MPGCPSALDGLSAPVSQFYPHPCPSPQTMLPVASLALLQSLLLGAQGKHMALYAHMFPRSSPRIPHRVLYDKRVPRSCCLFSTLYMTIT